MRQRAKNLDDPNIFPEVIRFCKPNTSLRALWCVACSRDNNDASKPMLVGKGKNALIAWTSKDCVGGGYEPLGEQDLYLVDGSQFCHDYSGEVEGLAEIPFSCVWATRGIIDEKTGEMTWTQGERLTSGRRDAFQLFAAVSGDGKAWGLTWQEDPKGLRPGEAAGPGEGMSGATVR